MRATWFLALNHKTHPHNECVRHKTSIIEIYYLYNESAMKLTWDAPISEPAICYQIEQAPIL